MLVVCCFQPHLVMLDAFTGLTCNRRNAIKTHDHIDQRYGPFLRVFVNLLKNCMNQRERRADGKRGKKDSRKRGEHSFARSSTGKSARQTTNVPASEVRLKVEVLHSASSERIDIRGRSSDCGVERRHLSNHCGSDWAATGLHAVNGNF